MEMDLHFFLVWNDLQEINITTPHFLRNEMSKPYKIRDNKVINCLRALTGSLSELLTHGAPSLGGTDRRVACSTTIAQPIPRLACPRSGPHRTPPKVKPPPQVQEDTDSAIDAKAYITTSTPSQLARIPQLCVLLLFLCCSPFCYVLSFPQSCGIFQETKLFAVVSIETKLLPENKFYLFSKNFPFRQVHLWTKLCTLKHWRCKSLESHFFQNLREEHLNLFLFQFMDMNGVRQIFIGEVRFSQVALLFFYRSFQSFYLF